tara:strand:+ start:512 stop:640 length:129 start_codon:yes stop_codon:yes gene_type:complete
MVARKEEVSTVKTLANLKMPIRNPIEGKEDKKEETIDLLFLL